MEFLFANKSSLLFVLGAGMIIVILMRRWSRYFKKQKSPKKITRRSLATCEADQRQPLLDAPPELLRWQVEMHETARDLKAELDTKIAVLQRLVIDARQQADRLEAIVDHAQEQP